MEKTLQVLNELERDGYVGRYAIGGAMAATFYAEPIVTFETGRDKDRERVTLLRRGSFDEALLTSIVLRYDLKARWNQ